MEEGELYNRFTYHPPTEEQVRAYERIREEALAFALLLNIYCPESREKSTALTKLDECVMHANASIARHTNA
ncbi:hypothetical protein SEA_CHISANAKITSUNE_20 [Gordonia phage ChisanaKitsune]|uniref:Acb2/Tad1 hairpin domain-containing protein n=1 Tax=Gordonia phage ChisanaKitsune TaxID=2871538 RepID=A0AAE7XF07_9CAUD|nr:hypothetical protein PQD15_gp020 [Gordonia phage ChisanaKitsune]QZE10791.1 hypothetical protein SEA_CHISANAKITSUNE_20 [Gordonia phage ChisanaKitsune]